MSISTSASGATGARDVSPKMLAHKKYPTHRGGWDQLLLELQRDIRST